MNMKLIIESVAIDNTISMDRQQKILEVLAIEENLCQAIANRVIIESADDASVQQSKMDKVLKAIKEVLQSIWKSITDFYLKHANVAERLYRNNKKDIEIGYANIKDNANTLDISKYNFKPGMADKIYDICERAILTRTADDGTLSEEKLKEAKKEVFHKISMEGISDDNILEPTKVDKYAAISLSDILETLREANSDRHCMEKAYSGMQGIKVRISTGSGSDKAKIEYTIYRNKLSISADILNKYSKQVVAKIRDNVKLAKHCVANSK